MLGAGRRQHAVRSRLRDLEEVSAIGARKWQLRLLADRARLGTASARRIRAAADNTGLRIGANPDELEAVSIVAHNLMSTARVTGAGAGGGVA